MVGLFQLIRDTISTGSNKPFGTSCTVVHHASSTAASFDTDANRPDSFDTDRSFGSIDHFANSFDDIVDAAARLHRSAMSLSRKLLMLL